MLLPFATNVYSQFGYYSTARVLEALPQYAQAVDEYERLCERCEKEISHNQKELTRQYVAFLDGQQDFPELILRKRQKELQQMVDNSVVFRKQLSGWLKQAKDSLLAPHNAAVDAALVRVCLRHGLSFAFDSDVVQLRFVNPSAGADITSLVIAEVLNPKEVRAVVKTKSAEPAEAKDEVNDAAEEQADVADDVDATDAVSDNGDDIDVATDSVDESVAVKEE